MIERHGELFVDREPEPGCSDLSMLRRWHAAFLSGKSEQRRIVLLEAEARLLRLSVGLQRRERRSQTSSVHGEFGSVERMTAFVAANYTKDIDIADIAASARMHPNSAMRLFRRSCGMTLLEYVNMHRVWHAQYLLAATDMKIRLVAERCGFSSPSRFYATFERVVGKRPGDYRRSLENAADGGR